MRVLTEYPQPGVDYDPIYGFLPIEFMLENLFEKGLDWFKNEAGAANEVYGHLLRGTLAEKYGQEKVDEIFEYITTNKLEIMQAFPISEEQAPSISLNIANAMENVAEAGLDDFAGSLDDTDSEGNVIGRTDLGYIPMSDSILVGIHATGSPDKCRFIYMLACYILAKFKHELMEDVDKATNGAYNITFNATDLSRLNEYLPQNMFNRFITVQTSSRALILKGKAPILGTIESHVDVE